MKKILLAIALLLNCSVSLAKELRIGLLQHDLGEKFKQRYEKGQTLHVEYLINDDYKILYGNPHIGCSLNSSGYTHSLFTGIVWQIDSKKYPFFLEFSFGGAIHNAELKKSAKKRAVGTRLLFRESFSIGFQTGDAHRISVIVDHMSNANSTKLNPGFTDMGVRYGFVL